jgi:hypothetical protein
LVTTKRACEFEPSLATFSKHRAKNSSEKVFISSAELSKYEGENFIIILNRQIKIITLFELFIDHPKSEERQQHL